MTQLTRTFALMGDTFWTTDDCETLEANRPIIYASSKTYFIPKNLGWLCMGSDDEDVDGFPYCNRLWFIVYTNQPTNQPSLIPILHSQVLEQTTVHRHSQCLVSGPNCLRIRNWLEMMVWRSTRLDIKRTGRIFVKNLYLRSWMIYLRKRLRMV